MSRYWGKSTIICTGCGRSLRGQHHSTRYCLPCADHVDRIKRSAYARLGWAIRTGAFPDWRGQKCHACEAPAIGYEHRDYSQPFDVRPICKSCNWALGPADKFIAGSDEMQAA